MKKFLSYFVYWLIQCTWGIIMTVIGAIVALCLLVSGHKPKTLGPAVYFEFGEGWGGLSLGGFFFCSKDSPMSTKYRECGHGLQNLVLGPFMPFAICIPSAARYWLYNFKTPLTRALFVLGIMIVAVLLTTSGACIFAFIGGFKAIVIIFEVIRLYFLSLVIWLNISQLPQFYDGKQPNYDNIWFEDQATKWGTALYEKKED